MTGEYIPVFLLMVGAHTALRLAYLYFIGPRLKRELHLDYTVRNPYHRWLRFRRNATFIVWGDLLTFGAICLMTLGTLQAGVDYVWFFLSGAALLTAGVLARISSRLTCNLMGDYWYAFFCRDGEVRAARRGINRITANPRYSLGYLHVVGFALITQSAAGLAFALFDWAVVWAFYLMFEKPGDDELRERLRARRSDIREAA